jgi:hypothetical protein
MTDPKPEQPTERIEGTEEPFVPTPTICQFCQPGMNFFTHSDDDGLQGCCSQLMDEGVINGAPVLVLCACRQAMPEPYSAKVLHKEIA